MDYENIYELIETVYSLATTALDKTTRLRQENNKLKQQIIELKNSAKDTNVPTKKKKRKFRAMTRQEFCKKWKKRHLYCKSDAGYCCPLYSDLKCFKNSMENPCEINGKYIFIEVKE